MRKYNFRFYFKGIQVLNKKITFKPWDKKTTFTIFETDENDHYFVVEIEAANDKECFKDIIRQLEDGFFEDIEINDIMIFDLYLNRYVEIDPYKFLNYLWNIERIMKGEK